MPKEGAVAATERIGLRHGKARNSAETLRIRGSGLEIRTLSWRIGADNHEVAAGLQPHVPGAGRQHDAIAAMD